MKVTHPNSLSLFFKLAIVIALGLAIFGLAQVAGANSTSQTPPLSQSQTTTTAVDKLSNNIASVSDPVPVDSKYIVQAGDHDPSLVHLTMPVAVPAATNTPTNTPTDTPTNTPTNTPTDTPTNTPTNTPTDTPTDTPTNTPTNTPGDTPTNTPTDTPTNTPGDTPTNTPTNTPTDTPTNTPTNTPTWTATDEPTPTPTATLCPVTRPKLVSPPDEKVFKKVRVLLDWSDVPCVQTYRVNVRYNGGPKVQIGLFLTESEFKTMELERGRAYQWRVIACNALGCERSKRREFYVAAQESRLGDRDNWMVFDALRAIERLQTALR